MRYIGYISLLPYIPTFFVLVHILLQLLRQEAPFLSTEGSYELILQGRGWPYSASALADHT